MVPTIKSVAVLRRSKLGYLDGANFIPFEMVDVNGMVIRTLVMLRMDVNDLGWPEEITITIESGDKLNGENT